MKTKTKMNNMNNKLNEKKKMRKFNTFYYVKRLVNIDNTNGLNVSYEDMVLEIFFTPDECYNYLIKHVTDLKDVLYDYINKTDFISKINYLKDKLTEINKYFSDGIIFKYDFFENDYFEDDSSKEARKMFYKRLVTETNEKDSFQIDANTKAIVNKDCIIKNYQNLYGVDIVSIKYDPNKINK